jgi:transposase
MRTLRFRLMMISFFEGLDSERGSAWAGSHSLTLRQFLRIGLDERTPDHVTISRTRRLIGAEGHQQVFAWLLKRLRGGLLKGKTIGVDSTTLEANAAMKSIVRRETQQGYGEYLKRLAQAEGVESERCSGAAAHGPQADEENAERGMGESGGCRSRDHAAERRAHRSGV